MYDELIICCWLVRRAEVQRVQRLQLGQIYNLELLVIILDANLCFSHVLL